MYYSKIAFGANVIDERFYIYDGLDCIAETGPNGGILREYIRIGNVGGIVAEVRHNDTTCATGYQSGTFYYHYNHRGDVIVVSANNTGTIIFKADYDAYGKLSRIDSGSFKPRYTFSTKRYFKELGLYYYGYRWYLPELGRWTTKDPIGHLSGELNLYKFCDNNGVFHTDPYGLCKDGKRRPSSSSVGTNDLSDDYLNSVIDITYDRLQSNPGMQATFDTEFWDGYKVDYYWTYNGKTYRGDDINYIGIGMYDASKGNSLNWSKFKTYLWKSQYGDHPNEDVLKWLEYGYNQYTNKNNKK